MSDKPNSTQEFDDNISEKSLADSEYEEIDLTENPLYQVLSAFFENEEGENLCDHVAKLTLAVEKNTKLMESCLKKCPAFKK